MSCVLLTLDGWRQIAVRSNKVLLKKATPGEKAAALQHVAPAQTLLREHRPVHSGVKRKAGPVRRRALLET
jgi:hypothetical protein